MTNQELVEEIVNRWGRSWSEAERFLAKKELLPIFELHTKLAEDALAACREHRETDLDHLEKLAAENAALKTDRDEAVAKARIAGLKEAANAGPASPVKKRKKVRRKR